MSFPPALLRGLAVRAALLAMQSAVPSAGPSLSLPQAPTSVWPTTVMGWLTLVVAVGGAVATIVAWGRLLEKLNGYGKRLDEVEGKVDKLATLVAEQTRSLDLVRAVHEAMLTQLGEAKKSAESCTEDMGDYARQIGSRLDEWRRDFTADMGALRKDFHEIDKTLSTELEGLKREVQLTRSATRRDS